MKIIAMTTLCADLFEASGEIRPGGEALNFAANACKYADVEVGVLGAIGDDEVGRHVLRAIEALPIRREGVHVVPGGETASHRISIDEYGDRYFKPGAWRSGVFGDFKFSPEDVALLHRADAAFITYSSPNFLDAVEVKKSADFKLAVDYDVCRDFARMEETLPWVDFFMISGDDSVLPIAKAWSEKYDALFNVTLAERGSVTYHHGAEYRVQAVPVDEVIDTTGCGDSYHAGFLCAYLRDGDIVAAMQEGSRLASHTLSHIGGF